MINPNDDGITHINIYSKGKTDLGKLLSNFAHTPVDLGEDGNFESLEGYWYWLLTSDYTRDVRVEDLRKSYGYNAKAIGRAITNGTCDYPPKMDLIWFKKKFLHAMEQKLIQHPNILEILIQSELPFKHYYVYGDKVVSPKGSGWQLDFWDQIRKEHQNVCY